MEVSTANLEFQQLNNFVVRDTVVTWICLLSGGQMFYIIRQIWKIFTRSPKYLKAHRFTYRYSANSSKGVFLRN
jgi:hypothetical protein